MFRPSATTLPMPVNFDVNDLMKKHPLIVGFPPLPKVPARSRRLRRIRHPISRHFRSRLRAARSGFREWARSVCIRQAVDTGAELPRQIPGNPASLK